MPGHFCCVDLAIIACDWVITRFGNSSLVGPNQYSKQRFPSISQSRLFLRHGESLTKVNLYPLRRLGDIISLDRAPLLFLIKFRNQVALPPYIGG